MKDLISTMMRSGSRVMNGTPVPFASNRMSFTSATSNAGDVQAAFDAHGSVGTLFAIVTQISTAVAQTEWHLYRRTSVRDKKRRKEEFNHGFMTVWDRPNQFYTGFDLRQTVQMHLDLTGEGFIVLTKTGGIVWEMWPVRPDRMQPVKHPNEFLIGWMYESPDGEKVPLQLDEVIHLKYPNPDDPYRGRGPVQTVLADIDAARYSAE